MSLSTYSGLKTAVSSWLKRSDLTNYLDDIVTLGETWIYRYARARQMETSLSVTISSGVAALPSDFIALKTARVSLSPTVRLEIRPADWIYDNYPNRSGAGIPKYVGVDGSNLIFGPYPAEYTILGTYYANLGSVANSAHALFLAAPDLYLYAALAEAEAFIKNDPRIQLWTSKRDETLLALNSLAHRSHFGDGLAVRAA